jgi:hypothetical protein
MSRNAPLGRPRRAHGARTASSPSRPLQLHPRSSAVRARRLVGTSVPFTPDGRYIIVAGRLWRATNPHLPTTRRQTLVAQLMDARRSVARALRAQDGKALRQARARVQAAKVALGERGPVWWTDGAPDFTRYRIAKSPYAAWFAGV